VAIRSSSFTVTTTAQALNVSENKASIALSNPALGATVYLGGSDVTAANGFPLAAGEKIALDLEKGDVVYAIVAASTQAISVLKANVA
jgi:hypothetical protein